MHSRIFYIAEHINTKKDFEDALYNAPDEEVVFEMFNRYADYLTEESSNLLDRSVEWFSGAYDFFEIKQDHIGFYFEITKETKDNLSKVIYKNIKEKITNLLNQIDINSTKNSVLLYQISDIAYPKFGMQLMTYEDYPESIDYFILNYGLVEEDQVIRYYFIKSFDYHF